MNFLPSNQGERYHLQDYRGRGVNQIFIKNYSIIGIPHLEI